MSSSLIMYMFESTRARMTSSVLIDEAVYYHYFRSRRFSNLIEDID